MTFSFRLQFNLVGLTRIDDPSTEWVLDSEHSVTLRPATGESIAESHKFIVYGSGYETATTASEAATYWHSLLTISLAAKHVPSDFGSRTGGGGLFTDEALALASVAAGVSVESDRRGVSIYPDGQQPLWIGADAVKLTHGVSGTDLLSAILRARDSSPRQLSGEVQLAYDLFSFALAEASPDARFVMLMMALETLIQQGQRPVESQDLIEQLKNTIDNSADVSSSERQSLKRCIDELKREAVGKAGRRLAKTLGARTYLNLSAV